MAKISTKKVCFFIAILVVILSVFLLVNPFLKKHNNSHQKRDYLLSLPAFDDFQKAIAIQPVFIGIEGEKQKQNLLSEKYKSLLSEDMKTCPKTDASYKKAAILFHNKDWQKAKTAFTKLLNQKATAQQVCVTYNLALIEKKLKHPTLAMRLFKQTTLLVADKGVQDPLHLGTSSYGDMAGLLLDQIGYRQIDTNGKVVWKIGQHYSYSKPVKIDDLAVLNQAIQLYVKQAVLGKKQAYDSIAIMMEGLMDPDNPDAQALFEKAVLDNRINPFIFAYIFNKNGDIYHPNSVRMKNNILQIFTVLEKGDTDLKGISPYMAMFAYQMNDFKAAKQWSQYDWTNYKDLLSAWILAKIALRENNKQQTLKYYHDVEMHEAELSSDIPDILRNRMKEEVDIINYLYGR